MHLQLSGACQNCPLVINCDPCAESPCRIQFAAVTVKTALLHLLGTRCVERMAAEQNSEQTSVRAHSDAKIPKKTSFACSPAEQEDHPQWRARDFKGVYSKS